MYEDHKGLPMNGTSPFAELSFEERIIEATKGMTFEQMHTYAVAQQNKIMEQDVWNHDDYFGYDDLIEELELLDKQLIDMNIYDLRRQSFREEQARISTLDKNRLMDQARNYNNGLSISVPFLRCNAQFANPSKFADRYQLYKDEIMYHLVNHLE